MSAPSLAMFKQQLRGYQQEVLSHALASGEGRNLYSLPTGSGKGSIQLALLQAWPDAWVVTPSLEVVRGYVERCGGPPASEPRCEDRIADEAAWIRVSTPVRLANIVARGEMPPPARLIIDEAHHTTDASAPSSMLAAAARQVVGFTATPFRGTPKETLALHDFWHGGVFSALSYRDAVDQGVVALPLFTTVPLLEDSVLSSGSEFDTAEADDLAVQFVRELADTVTRVATRPTLVVVPGLRAAEALCREMGTAALHLSGETPSQTRASYYQKCREGRAVLVTFGVAVEGVDLPWLRILVDARPTKSPVRWLQTLGRITRPAPGDRPLYVGVTHNLERHAYTLEGLVPPTAVTEAQTVWGPAPNLQALASRAGVEVLKKYKPIPLPLLTGATAAMYSLWSHNEDGEVAEYVVLVSPYFEALAAERKARGAWQQVPVRPASGPVSKWRWWRSTRYRNTEATEKQKKWWKNVGAFYGLDPAATVTSAQVQGLSVLAALRKKLV